MRTSRLPHLGASTPATCATSPRVVVSGHVGRYELQCVEHAGWRKFLERYPDRAAAIAAMKEAGYSPGAIVTFFVVAAPCTCATVALSRSYRGERTGCSPGQPLGPGLSRPRFPVVRRREGTTGTPLDHDLVEEMTCQATP